MEISSEKSGQKDAGAAEVSAENNNEAGKDSVQVVYPDDERIDVFVRLWNEAFPGDALGLNDLTPYEHHASVHKNQVKTNLRGIPALISSRISGEVGVSVIYDAMYNRKADAAESNRQFFHDVLHAGRPSLSEEEIQARWDEVTNNASSGTKWSDGVSVDVSGSSSAGQVGSFDQVQIYI